MDCNQFMEGCLYCYEDYNYNNNYNNKTDPYYPTNSTEINNSTLPVNNTSSTNSTIPPVTINVKCSMCIDGFYELNGTCMGRKACDDGFAFNKTIGECQKCETNDC